METNKPQVTEMNNNLHHKWDDADYIRRMKVDNYDSYTDLMDKFDKMCKGMSPEELDKKYAEVKKAHEHVNNSLEAQKLCRSGKEISDVLKKTAYTKGLLEDQLEVAKSYRKKHFDKQKLKPIKDYEQ
jgi:hypothetical protein